MRSSMHAISPLNLKEGNVVAQCSSWLERSVKGMAQVFVNGNAARSACRPLGETG
jgi:hypothetical protein